MSSTVYVETNKLPSHIRALCGNAKMAAVWIAESVTIGSLQWSEGSRDVYTIAHLDSSTTRPVTDVRPWPQNMAPMGETRIPERFVIVKTGTFCGKPATPYIYARSADIAPLLPKSDHALSFRQKQVLAAAAAYNSSGRDRFRSEFRVSKEAWTATVESLAAMGLMTNRGAVTVEGRNLANSFDRGIINPYSAASKES